MKKLTQISNLLVLMAAVAASGSMALQAQTHYVVTGDDIYRAPNSGSVFRLSGSTLLKAPALETGGWGIGGAYFGANGQAIATIGSNVCVFVTDSGSGDIAAFDAGAFTSPSKVGNYIDPSGSGAYLGTTLAVHGDKLFTGYTASVNIGVWTINSDCSLTLSNPAGNTPTPAPVDGLAVTPDGRTLVATYGQTEPGVGSFAISGTTLTPKGPYNTTAGTAGLDITKDSKYALVGEYGGTFPQVEIFPINADSTLGASTAYSFPQGGFNSNNVLLSPDESRLYIDNNATGQITTLAFNETAPAGKQLQFFCLSNPVRIPAFGFLLYTSGLAAESTTGKGGYLYMIVTTYNAQFVEQSAVAMLQIPPDTCPAEVGDSPFPLPANSFPTAVSAYPPRPF